MFLNPDRRNAANTESESPTAQARVPASNQKQANASIFFLSVGDLLLFFLGVSGGLAGSTHRLTAFWARPQSPWCGHDGQEAEPGCPGVALAYRFSLVT